MNDETKQKIAAELNLSETAFIAPLDGKDGLKYSLRWFTPAREVDLCGHGTLASAKALFDRLKRPESELETTLSFQTKAAGILTTTLDRSTGLIRLNFPSNAPKKIDPKDHFWLRELIRLTLAPCGDLKDIEEVQYGTGPGAKKLVIRLKGELNPATEEESLLLKLRPDFRALTAVKDNDLILGVIVTIKGSEEINFYSRYFAPWVGIDEDPVTGSAHTVLAPFWQRVYPGRPVLLGKQSSLRGGLVHCRLDETNGRVDLEGSAKIVIRGELEI